MSFFKPRKVEKNYDLLSAYSWYTPDVGGLFAILGWFLAGMILASIVVMPLMFGDGVQMCYVMMIMYPLQFLPVLIFAKVKSTRNAIFDRGYALDSSHFGSRGGLFMAVTVAVATIATAMMLESVNHFLPDTEGTVIEQMEQMMQGPLWVNLLTMCIMAPIFEEWLCRGLILRGLLNYAHKTPDAEGTRTRGMSPALAITISAIFFAAIHGNIWQGVTAFAIGCLFGYVYYKTGSLKLSMLMHCTNNTMAVLIGKFGSESMKDAKSLVEVIPAWEYAIIFAVSVAVLFFLLSYLRSIPQEDPQGNCDVIPSIDDTAADRS